MPEELEKFAWPGCYTLLYNFTVDSEPIILCWECATKAVKGIEEQNSDYEYYKQCGSFIHWEGSSLWCDDCGTELESEYGDPNEEKEPRVDAGELACEKTPTLPIPFGSDLMLVKTEDNHEPVDVLQYEREVTEYK